MTRQLMPAAIHTAIGPLLQSGCCCNHAAATAAAALRPLAKHPPTILLAQVQLARTCELARPPTDEQHQCQGAIHAASWRQVDPCGAEAHGQLCQPVRRGGVEHQGQGITAVHQGALPAIGSAPTTSACSHPSPRYFSPLRTAACWCPRQRETCPAPSSCRSSPGPSCAGPLLSTTQTTLAPAQQQKGG
jgi:hypothetical protein